MSKKEQEQTSNRPTHTIEDYLMTMYVMERDLGAIIAARLAEMMEVAPATVTMTLKRMERDRWIAGKARKEIHLTEEGSGSRPLGDPPPHAGRMAAGENTENPAGANPRRSAPHRARHLAEAGAADARNPARPQALPARQPLPGSRRV